nr:MAG TPA: hypothetical protein [Caudoviricetes sp.]
MSTLASCWVLFKHRLRCHNAPRLKASVTCENTPQQGECGSLSLSFLAVGFSGFIGNHAKSATFQPRFQIDVAFGFAILDVGVAPFGILIIGEVGLKNEYHFVGSEEVGIFVIAQTTYFVSYPIGIAYAIEQLHVHSIGKSIASSMETLNKLGVSFRVHNG